MPQEEERQMHISNPIYSQTRNESGGGIPSLREAFYTTVCSNSVFHYVQNERIPCLEFKVPRKTLGEDGFHELLRDCGADGVKWVYTIYHQLYIVPCRVRLDESQELSPENSFEPPHTFAADNQPCLCAGEARYDAQSEKVTVTNHSGHYKPTKLSFWHHVGAIWFPTGFNIVIGEVTGKRSRWSNGVEQSLAGCPKFY